MRLRCILIGTLALFALLSWLQPPTLPLVWCQGVKATRFLFQDYALPFLAKHCYVPAMAIG